MNWKSTYRILGALLFISSGAAVSYGAYLMWPPLGWVAGGGFLFALSTAYVDAAKKEKP